MTVAIIPLLETLFRHNSIR